MNLPKLTNPKPVDLTPPVAKFNEIANTVLVVRPHANHGKGTASLRFCPYDFDTKTVLEDPRHELKIDTEDLEGFLAERPRLQEVIGMLAVELGIIAEQEYARLDAEAEAPQQPEEPTP